MGSSDLLLGGNVVSKSLRVVHCAQRKKRTTLVSLPVVEATQLLLPLNGLNTEALLVEEV